MSGDDGGYGRRTVLKGIGGAAGTALVGGAGLVAMTGAAAAGVSMMASDPAQVSNDRGDLTKVTVDPSFRVEWEGFDQAVGKVMVLVEARTKDGGDWKTRNPASESTDYFVPIFRATPWLTEDMEKNGGPHIDYSEPGTTGYIEYSSLGDAIAYASRVRDDSQYPKSRPIEVVNEIGQPDYESGISGYPGDMDGFLLGNNMGPASDYSGESTLVNNFPGAGAGYYGAAIDTAHFDVGTDGTEDSDTVELRYTFALLTVNDSMVAPENAGSGWYSGVTKDDVTVGNSVLAMGGDGEYDSVTDHGAGGPASKYYPAYHSMKDSHPAVIVDRTDFAVTVVNQPSENTGDGDTNASAE